MGDVERQGAMRIPAHISILGSPESLTWAPNTLSSPPRRNLSETSFLSRQFFLACNETLTTLFLIDGTYATPIDKPTGLKASAYRLWSGFKPDDCYRFNLPEHNLKRHGSAYRICYQSDKWDGKLTHYFHDFEDNPDVFVNRYSNPTIWAIKHKRGRIVSAEGII